MSAPSLWIQILIALLAIGSIPTVITLFAKLHLLPLAVYLLGVSSFPLWAEENRTVAIILFAVCVLYPAMVWGSKALRWWQEERQIRFELLANAIPLNSVQDVLKPQGDDWYDETDW